MTSTYSRSLPLILLVGALAACKTTVIGGRGGDGGGVAGGGGGGGVGGDIGIGGSGGGVAVGPTVAIAERAFTKPNIPAEVDPNTLYVRIGNHGVYCGSEESAFSVCSSETAWQVSISIPPQGQAPGVHSLTEPGFGISFSMSGGGGPQNECWGGGGGGFEGTVEIVSIDQSTIVVRLADVDAYFTDFAAEGQYAAPICP